MSDAQLEYRPCDNCDGWLITQSREFRAMGDGYYETYLNWVCYTCGNKEKQQDRDVPIRDSPNAY